MFKVTVCGNEKLMAKYSEMYSAREILNPNTAKYFIEIPKSDYEQWFEIDYSADQTSVNCKIMEFGLFKDSAGTQAWGRTTQERRLVQMEGDSIIIYF